MIPTPTIEAITSEAATIEAALFNVNQPIITLGYVMQVFFSLLIVLGLIYFLAKFLLPRLKVTPGNKIIKVLDRVYLEPQVSVYILKIGKTSWLIGVSGKSITRIDKLEEGIPEIDQA